ncbi:dyslexia-associated protein KIAA0319-like protein isoform X2 [Amphibalanus amphitrite]|uniref:dyslexia-associated protein KIAA0319-like protein isoform X2 n=1 Tax=Amphibalanus amphitrite TaxID=1232801 RepID=UPI001C8FFCCB|nr:dyslexia-associated protein KIAA0319-like protein isoform X2 [Amphibalanus amphitrite]
MCQAAMWLCLLLAASCQLSGAQTTLAASSVTETPLPAGCSAAVQSGRRLDLTSPSLTKLANISTASATASCPHLCCGQPRCRLAVLEGDECVLLACGRDGCDTLPKRHRSHKQKVWLISWERSAAELPATAALLASDSSSASPPPSPSRDATGQPCEPSVSAACPPSQQCEPLPDRPEAGVCRCPPGQVLGEGGQCGPPAAAAASTEPPPPTVSTAAPLAVRVVNKTITLPESDVRLEAVVDPPPADGESYTYMWQLLPEVSTPVADGASMSDAAQAQFKLRHLTAGVYVFQLDVEGRHSLGRTVANVTVKPAPRVNQPPVAVVSPVNQTLYLPNSKALLEGSDSTDDLPSDQLVYNWEVVAAPLTWPGQELPRAATLQLENLTPGNYTIRLTVEDAEHLSSSADAHIIVLKEVDYAPQANAGEDVVVYLPTNAVTLYGNASTDDKGIVSYEWTKAPGSEDRAVDMQDTHKPFLHLSNLEKGVYEFILKVTDSAEHTSTDSVLVVVKSQPNTPPTAVAGKNQTLTLPRTWAVLDGSGSHDNLRVTSWLWEQISGPTTSKIVNSTQPVANATSLTRGLYVFRLTVWDDASNSSALTNVTVIQATNAPPVADAGGDLTVHLPVSVVTLNGSRSSDDVRIVSWKWSRDGSSLAAGRVVGDTDTACSLQLVDMVAGLYRFHLTVTDEQGATARDTVSVVIQEDPYIDSQIRVELDVPFGQWTQAQQEALVRKVALLVPSSGDVQVRLLRWSAEPRTGHLLVELTASETTLSDGAKPQIKMLPGVSVVSALRAHLRSDPSALDHAVLLLDTVTCQNPCSGHGRCDETTRLCVCDRFWTENFFKRLGSDGQANCDWSVLYVIIISFSLVVALGVAVWAAICLLRRRCGSAGVGSGLRRTRRARYTPVSDPEGLQMLPKNGGHSASSLMASETDSESEPLFEAASGRRRPSRNNKRRKRNGVSRPPKAGKKM